MLLSLCHFPIIIGIGSVILFIKCTADRGEVIKELFKIILSRSWQSDYFIFTPQNHYKSFNPGSKNTKNIYVKR